MAAPATVALHEIVSRRLVAHGARLTANRTVLVDVLASADRPLTIHEILERRRGLAQSSVYRSLVVLERAGVVRRLVTHDEFARYELAEDLTEHHHHVVCSQCGLVEDVAASAALERSVADTVARVSRSTGFRIEHHRLDLVGLCGRCA